MDNKAHTPRSSDINGRKECRVSLLILSSSGELQLIPFFCYFHLLRPLKVLNTIPFSALHSVMCPLRSEANSSIVCDERNAQHPRSWAYHR